PCGRADHDPRRRQDARDVELAARPDELPERTHGHMAGAEADRDQGRQVVHVGRGRGGQQVEPDLRAAQGREAVASSTAEALRATTRGTTSSTLSRAQNGMSSSRPALRMFAALMPLPIAASGVANAFVSFVAGTARA